MFFGFDIPSACGGVVHSSENSAGNLADSTSFLYFSFSDIVSP